MPIESSRGIEMQYEFNKKQERLPQPSVYIALNPARLTPARPHFNVRYISVLQSNQFVT